MLIDTFFLTLPNVGGQIFLRSLSSNMWTNGGESVILTMVRTVKAPFLSSDCPRICSEEKCQKVNPLENRYTYISTSGRHDNGRVCSHSCPGCWRPLDIPLHIAGNLTYPCTRRSWDHTELLEMLERKNESQIRLQWWIKIHEAVKDVWKKKGEWDSVDVLY